PAIDAANGHENLLRGTAVTPQSTADAEEGAVPLSLGDRLPVLHPLPPLVLALPSCSHDPTSCLAQLDVSRAVFPLPTVEQTRRVSRRGHDREGPSGQDPKFTTFPADRTVRDAAISRHPVQEPEPSSRREGQCGRHLSPAELVQDGRSL